ncbi:MAG TPA: HD domain-containing protein [Solirubrobacterales bacterium]
MPETPRIEAAAERSPLLREALRTAHSAHAGQIRNGSGGMAYVEHPRGVAEMLAEEGFEDEILAAALLHDVVEDSELGVEDLRGSFGDRIAGIVGALSDDESIEDYRVRKVEHRERVAAAGREALAIYAADKLSNVRTLRGALAAQGEESVAREFKVPLDVKLEVWEADLELLREKAPDLPFVGPLEEELRALQAERQAPAPRS